MNICIYINNSGIKNVDCSNLLIGNPGIGGTEYCILFLAQIYKKQYPSDKVVLIVHDNGLLPSVDEIIVCKDLLEVPYQAKKSGADVLVVSSLYNGQPLPETFFENADNSKINVITWGHNYYLADYCTRLVKCRYVKANVFVGRQQYDRYIDHKIIDKSTYIYNMYPQNEKIRRKSVDKPVVTYIGSLVPMKGFQVLATAWKTILSAVPNAELNVIGSGKLYSRDAQLGSYGIADKAFEKRIMPCLTDETGNILPSVHFLGVLGAEKDEVIAHTSVGVVNPTGRTETFGISALDFESMSVPVVTIAKGGFLDTVIDKKTGLLYQNEKELPEKVIELLKDIPKNEQYGAEGYLLSKSFAPEIIIQQWHELFHAVINGETIPYRSPDSFYHTNLKRWRILNRNLKKKLHIKNGVSVIGLETMARKLLRRLGR
ncbi:MAG: glycosyltransferase family 4 protein [Clostridia bacterium]|nr:glycosyltransferase family 4 protein [Clostridia bacterium]